MSVTTNAENDYLKRHNLTEQPQNFSEQIAPIIAPLLASCDCMINQIEKRWSYDYFLAHQAELPPIVNEIMTGACAVQKVPSAASAGQPN